MAIWKNRKRAEAALSEHFDLRAFHDAILALGSVPLSVLDARIDQFIADGKAKTNKAGQMTTQASRGSLVEGDHLVVRIDPKSGRTYTFCRNSINDVADFLAN